MQVPYVTEEDVFVDAKDSWDATKTDIKTFKAKEEVRERVSLGEKERKLPLLVPRNVVDKLTFPINNTPTEHIRVFGNSYSSQESTDFSSLDVSLKKGPSLSSKEIHTKLDDNIKSRSIKRASSDIPVKEAKSQKITTKRVEMKRIKKRTPEFDNLYFLQELKAGDGSIWAAQFSPDGNFFVTGGVDRKIKVWGLNDSSQECNSFFYFNS